EQRRCVLGFRRECGGWLEAHRIHVPRFVHRRRNCVSVELQAHRGVWDGIRAINELDYYLDVGRDTDRSRRWLGSAHQGLRVCDGPIGFETAAGRIIEEIGAVGRYREPLDVRSAGALFPNRPERIDARFLDDDGKERISSATAIAIELASRFAWV